MAFNNQKKKGKSLNILRVASCLKRINSMKSERIKGRDGCSVLGKSNSPSEENCEDEVQKY